MILTAALLLALVGQVAPHKIGPADQYTRPGAPHSLTVTTITTAAKAISCNGSTSQTALERPCWFPWGARLKVKASKAATCCFSMTSSVSMGAYTSTTSSILVDSIGGKSGRCAGLDLAAGETVDVVVDRDSIITAPGTRYTRGVCTKPAPDIFYRGENVFPSCTATADCTYNGGGTCDTSLSAADVHFIDTSGGSALMCDGSASATRMSVGAQE